MVIDAYITSLRGALRGPRAAKADLITEARDSLTDAAAHYEAEGLDRAAAERAAVDEFGPVADLAPEYQRELALAQGRRTALIVAAAVAIESVVSEYAWRRAAAGWTWQPDRAYEILARTVDYATYAVVVGALLAALACGIGTRWVSVGRGFVRATGITALAVVAFFTAGGLTLSAFSPVMGGHHETTPLSLTAHVVTALMPMAMTFSGLRCMRAARG